MQSGKGRNVFAYIILAICIVFGAFGQIFMKTGMNQLDKIEGINSILKPDTIMGVLLNKYVMGGLFLYFVAAFLWLAALSTLDVSFMYPLLSFAYIITAFFAYWVIGENVTTMRWVGTVLIVLGCILISRS